MRDEAQERSAIAYIENNPTKARLCKAPDEWAFSSARFRDQHRRLAFPGATMGGGSLASKHADDCAVPEAGAPTQFSARRHVDGDGAAFH
jgi:hypothetical protein